MADDAVRRAAASAVACAAGGALAVSVAVVAGPGVGAAGYVSEAGTDTYPLAGTYQVGVLVLSAGMVLLAGALAPAARVAAALLAGAGLFAGLSGAVTCSAGCPLPPHEPATGADLVHAGSSIVGMALCVFAMVAVAATADVPRRLRRFSGSAAALALPLAVALGLAMLLVGRGALIGALERVLLSVATTWLMVTATLRAAAPGSRVAGDEQRSPIRRMSRDRTHQP